MLKKQIAGPKVRMAQSVKCLHVSMRTRVQSAVLMYKQSVGTHACNPRSGEIERGGSLGCAG